MNICTKEIQKFKSCHADIVITPDLGGMSQLGYNKENTMLAIKRGERATIKQMENIIKLIKSK